MLKFGSNWTMTQSCIRVVSTARRKAMCLLSHEALFSPVHGGMSTNFSCCTFHTFRWAPTKKDNDSCDSTNRLEIVVEKRRWTSVMQLVMQNFHKYSSKPYITNWLLCSVLPQYLQWHWRCLQVTKSLMECALPGSRIVVSGRHVS